MRPCLRDKRSGGWALHHVGLHFESLGRWLLHGPRFQEAAYDTIRTLLVAAERQRINVDVTDQDNLTAFQIALSEPGEDTYTVEAFFLNGIKPPDTTIDDAVISCTDNEENASKLELVLRLLGPSESVLEAALFLSIHVGAVAAVRSILDRAGQSLLHSRDENQRTPLHWAAEAGELSMAKLLLDRGSNLNAVDSDSTPPIGCALSGIHCSIEIAVG